MFITFIKELTKRLNHDDAFGLSAQCSYYFLLSLFPFLLFLMSLLGFLPITTEDVIGLAKEYVPASVTLGLEEQLRSLLDSRRGDALSFGLIFSLFTASAAMDAIVLAVNKAYGLPARKSYIHSKLLAIALTMGMLVVVFSALLLSVFGHLIGDWMHTELHLEMKHVQLWNVLRWILNIVILFLIFIAIYYIAPNTCLNCKDVLPGAVFAAVGWQLTSYGFSFYLSQWNHYNVTYGSLGGVIVLLTWFYLCALVIIIGGEINAMAYMFQTRKKHPV
ncbi:YihY/virulence factor BrkB family protein [Paenibacillus foliorum]|uniref:YihY/virulence factor BrkB family protein n=1 Tax=Paenibacillus foliorum TaxID=2654974 RepID=UPI001C1082AA|nr:YihY/virulence factor BrkB family protein [Paenibacillus foliorum]